MSTTARETRPMSDLTKSVREKHREFLFPATIQYYQEPIVVTEGKGLRVKDADGNEYLDFFGGILTVSVGHANEKVNAAIKAQVDRLSHISTLYPTLPVVELAERLARLTPGDLKQIYFTASGTEADETAVMMAELFTGRSEVIALRHSYHGRSALGMTLSGQSAWRLGGVSQPGIVHAHNAYCYRCPFGLTYPECEVRCASDIEDLIRTATSGRIAGFIGEPIQGVGGFITPPREYFPIVASIVRKYGGVFISDEVQTAWGRTGGKWFGIEHWGVMPDVITAAKGLGNGTPVGLTVATPEVADAVKGLTISTFGGNPIATTAAKAVIDFIDEENLLANAAETGAYLRARLEELREKYTLIGDVRGMGLMQALELVRDRTTREPAVAATIEVMEAARANRVLVGKGGLYGNVIRISPPLNIARADVDEFVRRLDASFARARAAEA